MCVCVKHTEVLLILQHFLQMAQMLLFVFSCLDLYGPIISLPYPNIVQR